MHYITTPFRFLHFVREINLFIPVGETLFLNNYVAFTLWSGSLLRLLNPDYIEITILRNVDNYQSSRRNTPEKLNLVSHYLPIFLSFFLLFLTYLRYSVRPVSKSQMSFASLRVSVQWRLLLKSVTVLLLPRNPLYRRDSGFVFRNYMSYRLFWTWFLGQSL